MRTIPMAIFLLLAACSGQAATGPSSEPVIATGELPPGNTAIGRAVAGDRCSRPQYCASVGYVDCRSMADGPAYFFRRDNGAIISVCGGACRGRQRERCARECPPPAWRAAGCQSSQPAR